MTRCKPGELAAIVRVPSDGAADNCLGRVVRVTRTIQQPHALSWRFEWNGKTSMERINGSRFKSIPDFALRPIRDPGEDATDETLLWTPVPNKQEQPA